jgi:lipoprotein-anchoring transpeptidase ErfK/SrfK
MLRMVPLLRGVGVALAIGSAPVTVAPASVAAPSVKSAKAVQPASIEERVAGLKPGQWVWRPELASAGPVELVVSLPMQMVFVYRAGTLIGAATVSTGMPGYETPPGRFRILQKREKHFSNQYDNAPMPFMQRLTWSGVALHAGAIPGKPASHGCVRLPKTFAAKLYGATSLGATVLIVDEAPSPEAAYALLQGRSFESAMGGPEEPIEEQAALEPSPAIAELERVIDGLAGEPR